MDKLLVQHTATSTLKIRQSAENKGACPRQGRTAPGESKAVGGSIRDCDNDDIDDKDNDNGRVAPKTHSDFSRAAYYETPNVRAGVGENSIEIGLSIVQKHKSKLLESG